MKRNNLAGKFSVIIYLAIFISSFSFNISAAEIPVVRQLPRVVDNANLLTEDEKSSLMDKVDEISERQNCDVAIVTVKSLQGKTATEYADDFYDYNGYGMGAGDDGILFLISMENRDWAISTYGYGIYAFSDAGQEYIMSGVKPILSEGKYFKAFETFADFCDMFIGDARSDKPYDIGNMPKGSLSPSWIFKSLGIGAIIALIIMSMMKRKLTSVKMESSAKNYVISGSMKLHGQSDRFLYRNVSKTLKPKESSSSGGSSTHTSSSGRSHGGSSGSF